jgi:hypothetical protein
MDLEFEIQLFIENEQKRNGNKSGTSIVTIQNEFGIPYNDLKPILNTLHQNKKIIARKGLNQLLIFIPKNIK